MCRVFYTNPNSGSYQLLKTIPTCGEVTHLLMFQVCWQPPPCLLERARETNYSPCATRRTWHVVREEQHVKWHKQLALAAGVTAQVTSLTA